MRPPVSFEFFPPNTTEGEARLRGVHERLARAAPEYFSVTYGAGGATRDKTLRTVLEIAAAGSAVAPHLSCIGATRESVDELLALYRSHGIRRLVALRGDLPSGMVDTGDFRYAADLVRHVRAAGGDWFEIAVAAYPEVHPQAASAQSDLDALVAKMAAGANTAITQYFYNVDAFLWFRDAAVAAGVNAPIVPGIMPITNYRQLARFSDACGAEIPRWIRQRLMQFGDDLPAIRAFGQEVVAAQCRRLIAEGVDALHFYTMNQAEPTLELLAAAGA
ncbi:MAG: methylenetetrahydrofolate reductase [NAD(P)H] [Betaproteobacteria bacterium]|jgi:methylenetetrahydrofolate reductase (NADPH)|nr:methylenetetrahydrofolate reductase [NAD(P)H] [Betaproteobacteria bacterium]